MKDSQCVEFLQWALPRLGMRWAGFRKVRRQVCKRLGRRLAELGLPDLDAYRALLERDPDEWPRLERLTHITISRFYRDRGVFGFLAAEVLPALAATGVVRAWSAGCASGEEAYTLAIVWELELAERFPSATFEALATDVEESMLGRARRGCYGAGSLRELPERWRAGAFTARGGEVCLRARFRELVSIERHDVLRDPPPREELDLVLCRNLAFTYFDEAGQRVVAEYVGRALRPGGALVIGRHETLPEEVAGFVPWSASAGVYRRVPAGS
ncbi:MAG: CheR family methyltransferase [Solirubrobacteraceae bacterium]